jgi:hypothetical protein
MSSVDLDEAKRVIQGILSEARDQDGLRFVLSLVIFYQHINSRLTGSFSALTVRIVLQRAESQMGLEEGGLESKEVKKPLRALIKDTIVRLVDVWH